MEIDIKKIRQDHSLSQKQLAIILGCTQECISNWERRLYKPSADLLIKLIKYFNIKI